MAERTVIDLAGLRQLINDLTPGDRIKITKLAREPGSDITRVAVETVPAEWIDHVCEQCGEPFESERPDARLCSARCRKAASRAAAKSQQQPSTQ